MAVSLGPVRVYSQLNLALVGSQQVPPVTIQLPNPPQIQAISLSNKGPFDIQFSGFGVSGQEWILAGTEKLLYADVFNQGQVTMIAISDEVNVNFGRALFGAYSIVLVQVWYNDDIVPNGNWPLNLPDAGFKGCEYVNAANSGGLNISVPSNTAKNIYLLGFDFTTATASTASSGTLLITNIALQEDGSNSMSFRVRADTTGSYILSIRFPGIGIPNLWQGGPLLVNFSVPSLSTATIDLIVYYSFYPHF